MQSYWSIGIKIMFLKSFRTRRQHECTKYIHIYIQISNSRSKTVNAHTGQERAVLLKNQKGENKAFHLGYLILVL